MISAIGDQSKNSIVQILRRRGPLSRAELARALELSSPTMTTNVKVLLNTGLLIEVGETESAIGRKATLLDFNAEVGFVIGIDVERNEVNAALTDLVGNVRASTVRDSKSCHTGEALFELITSSIDELIERSGIMRNKLVCICVGIPGIFDEQSGYNQMGSYLNGWDGIRSKERLLNRYKVDIVIDNNCNTGGMGEKWRGECQDCDNFLYIDYNVGIGSAIFINGELYRGFNGAAGEFGYMALDRYYLRRAFKEEGALEEEICTHALEGKLGGKICADDFFSLLDSGDPKAQSLMNEMTIYFGMCVANAVSVLNPQKVIISGKLGIGLMSRHRERLINIVKTHVPFPPEIVSSKLGSKGHVLGAVFMAIEGCIHDYRRFI